MYPCVSFVYLSLLSLSVLLFKIFNFRFHVFLTGLFPHAFGDSRYSAQRSCAIGSIVVFIYAEYFCSSFQVIQQLRYVFFLDFCLQRSSVG